MDKGEKALDAARRELFEETGVRSAEYLGEARFSESRPRRASYSTRVSFS